MLCKTELESFPGAGHVGGNIGRFLVRATAEPCDI